MSGYRMRKADKDAWVAALRSGRYSQTRGALHRLQPGFWDAGADENVDVPVGFCCLGVLSEVMSVPSCPDNFGTKAVYEWNYGTYVDHSSSLIPRRRSQEWGIPDEDIDTLIEMNDEAHKDFGEIADWIERTVLDDHV